MIRGGRHRQGKTRRWPTIGKCIRQIEYFYVVIRDMKEVESVEFEVIKRDIDVQSLLVEVQEKESEV